jgi:hypothetical protein
MKITAKDYMHEYEEAVVVQLKRRYVVFVLDSPFIEYYLYTRARNRQEAKNKTQKNLLPGEKITRIRER